MRRFLRHYRSNFAVLLGAWSETVIYHFYPFPEQSFGPPKVQRQAGPERTLTNSACATAPLNNWTLASALEKTGAAA